jgi:hypothetical protein
MIENRIEVVGRETLRIRGTRGVLRQADAAPRRAPSEWVETAVSVADQRGADWGIAPSLAECLVPALRVLSSQGKSTKDIARQLNLGIGTVKVHMSALYSALGVSTRSAALAASYHHLSQFGQARGAVAAAAA